MKEIDDAIKVLATRAAGPDRQAHESMQLAQAVLSLMQASSVRMSIDKYGGGDKPQERD